MNKKGAYGLEVVTLVALGLFILLVIAVAMMSAISSLNDVTLITDRTVNNGNVIVNETINMTTAGNTPATLASVSKPILSSAIVTNATGGEVLTAGNYTISGGLVQATASSTYKSLNVNVSGTYTYVIDTGYGASSTNLSQGFSNFFGNSTTFFSILAVVVVMIFLGLMIGAVWLFTRGKVDKGI